MKQFETKLTVRIYDTRLIESLNTIFKLSKNRYQTKNQLIVELLERGIKDKMKEFPTPPDTPAGASAIPPIYSSKDDMVAMLKQLKDMIAGVHEYNKDHIEGLLAHLKMSEKMSACIYNILVAIATDKPITETQVEVGYLDDVPKRFIGYLNSLLKALLQSEEDDGDSEDIPGIINK